MEARLQHIRTNLVTGYPGAGKTTAIRSLLALKPEGERWAVLVNDIGHGDTGGWDFPGIGNKDVTVGKVAGGCICCTARLSLRRVALIRLLRKARPQRLLIEAAGVAQPAAVMDTLRDPWVAEALDLRAAICIADPRQFADSLLAATEIYLDQLAFADVVIANKSDLATVSQLQALLDYARGLHPRKRRTRAARDGEFPFEWLDLAPAPRRPGAACKALKLTRSV
jgi:G3E family GTPase